MLVLTANLALAMMRMMRMMRSMLIITAKVLLIFLSAAAEKFRVKHNIDSPTAAMNRMISPLGYGVCKVALSWRCFGSAHDLLSKG